MNPEELGALLSSRESFTVEVKIDTGPLSEAELVEAAVCLANAQGRARRTTGAIGSNWPSARPGSPQRRGIPK
jgi:hypothetical protein